jgi:enoyl-CoA hydratase/carnithine racemase
MLPGRPASRRAGRTAVADDVVDLGLAEHLVDRHAQLLAAPGEHRVAHRLAGAHQALQVQTAKCAGSGAGLHHGLERGREQEAMRHAVLLHQLENASSGLKRPL